MRNLRFVKVIPALLIIMLLTAISLFPATLTKNTTEHILQNGLKVIIKENHTAPLVFVGISYRVGFGSEKTGISGISHFLEHMLFQETKNYKKGKIASLVKEMGGYLNGFTSLYKTTYFEVLPASGLKTALKIESDRMQNAKLLPEEFKRERKVVLSEIDNHSDSPWWDLYAKLYPELFGKSHPLALRFTLHQQNLRQLKVQTMKKYYQKFYSPANAVLVVVGDFKRQSVLKLVKKYFAQLKNRQSDNFTHFQKIPFKKIKHRIITVKGKAERPFGVVKYYFPHKFSINNKDSVMADFLSKSGIIKFSYNKAPTATYLSQSISGSNFAYLADSINAGFISKYFLRLKTKFLNRLKLSHTKIDSQGLALSSLGINGHIGDYDKLLAAYKRITVADVLQFISTYLKKENAIVGIFQTTGYDKNKKVKKLPFTQGGESFLQEKLNINQKKKASPREIKKLQRDIKKSYSNIKKDVSRFLSSVKTYTMPNGLKVILRSVKDIEYCRVLFSVPAGIYAEAGRKPFLADWTSQLVFSGGPFIRLKNRLAERGGRISGGWATFDDAKTTMMILPNQVRQSLQLLGMAVKKRKFTPYVLEVSKYNKITSIKSRPKSTNRRYFAWLNIEKELYPSGHPFHDRAVVSKRNIAGISIKDVKSFYTDFYTPHGSTLVIVGNFDEKNIRKWIKKNLGDWKNKRHPAVSIPELNISRKNSTIKKNMGSKKQNIIYFGRKGISIADPAYLPLKIGQTIIGGGGLTSKLMSKLRNQMGLTYGVYLFLRSSKYDLGLLGFIQTAPENSKKAISAIMNEFKTYNKGLSGREILKAKNYLLNRTVFLFKTPYNQASTLLQYSRDYGSTQVILRQLKKLSRLSIQQVNEAVRKFIPAQGYFISIAGEVK